MKPLRSVSLILALTASCSAFPFAKLLKRQTLSDLNDADILNYALTLEHLEATFYRQGLANFSSSDFTDAGFNSSLYQNIQRIASDESSHVDFITSALTAAGAPATAECTYAFGVTSPASFLATASILEGVGVSGYLGAAAQIANKAYLTAAGSILTVEARHNAYLRATLGEAPFAQPFDTPLSPDEVYTLAHGFIASCPSSNPAIKVRPFPGLAVDSANAGAAITTGSVVTVDTRGFSLEPNSPSAVLYAAFVSVTGPVWTNVTELPGSGGTKFSVTIPQGVEGQSYLVFTGCRDAVTDDTVVAGPALIEISA
ncbi:Ferritin/ribonucleotide reductase-like protein [Viridothelium virens]|uniref:Ferritin/ribonucleotide reductase-like protein n=1 Tax=Viridothelium virens TaxID=1048519 RepID=A0A6A6H6F1_VIRVR|nr:Ferritin/ribonucleotide reductase-like protein [Viridothelium virens]